MGFPPFAFPVDKMVERGAVTVALGWSATQKDFYRGGEPGFCDVVARIFSNNTIRKYYLSKGLIFFFEPPLFLFF